MNINPEQMQIAADQACDLLKAMANRHRLMLMCKLLDAERSVGELAAFLGLRDSTVSQHLALLRKDGLVLARRSGQTIWYSIKSPTARQLIETLYRLYCAPQPLCGRPTRQRNVKRTAKSGKDIQ